MESAAVVLASYLRRAARALRDPPRIQPRGLSAVEAPGAEDVNKE